MPFLVTMTQRLSCTCWGTVGEDESGMCDACHAGGEKVERVAVATLDGREVWNAFYGINVPRREDVVDQIAALGDSGGTVGPLPDGTTITVEPATWAYLADEIDEDWLDPTHKQILAAYNAAQQARA